MRLATDSVGMTLLLGALIAAAPFAMDIYLASMPSTTRALGASTDEVQLTLSVYMYGWGIAQLFAGPVSDRFGRRPSLLVGLAAFVAASAFCAASRNVYVLIGGRLVQAISMATIAVVPRAVVRDLYSGDKAAHMLSLMAIVLGLAPIVAPLVGSNMHVLFGWQSNFVLVAAYGALLWFFVFRALPETLAQPDVRATAPLAIVANYRRLLRSREYVGFMLTAAFGFSGLFAFLAGSAFVFVSVMGAGEQGFGMMFGAVMLGNISGAVIGSRIVRRVGIARIVRTGTALMLVAGAALAAFAFCQFVVASTAALAVGLALDGTARPMAFAIGAASLGAFASVRIAHRRV